MQVKGLNLSITAWPSWTQFLKRSTLLSAALLLGSALVMIVAANWLSWPHVARIALVELCVAALVWVAVWLARREPKEWATAYSLSSLVHMLAAISVGALLALIGQSYQTGADPWQLFALWAVLLMPWAFGLGSLFIILLVLLLTNLALFLFMEGQARFFVWFALNQDDYALWFVLLNAVWLGLSRLGAARYQDPHQLWFKLSFVLVVGSSVTWCLMQTQYEWAILTMALVVLGGCSYLSRRRGAVWQLAVWYSALFVLSLAWLIYGFRQLYGVIELLFIPMSLLAVYLIRDLRRVWRQHVALSQAQDQDLDLEPSQTQPPSPSLDQSEPWFLRGFIVLAQLVILVLFIWLIVGVLDLDPVLVAYVYLPCVFLWLVYLLRTGCTHSWTQDLPLFLLSTSAFFMGVLLFEHEDWTLLWVAAFGVALAIIYGLSAAHYLVRLSSALLGLGLLSYGWYWQVSFELHATSQILWFVGLLWLGLSVLLSRKPSLRANWQPLWWASSVWIVVLVLWGEGLYLHWVHFMAFTVPLLMAVCLGGTQSRWFSAVAVLFAAVLSFFWMVHAPLVNLALGLWLLSYQWKQSRLFVSALLLFVGALAHYYYALDTTLLQKSWDLTQGALLLGLAAWLLHRQATAAQPSVTKKGVPVADSRRLQWVLLGGWALIVAVTVWDVARKEQLLAQGQTLVLELAPVDPRSLMQGDYMALRFAVGQAISHVENRETGAGVGRELIAYMQPQDNAPALLVALKNPTTDQVWLWQADTHTWSKAPPSFQPDAQLLALRFNQKAGDWLPNGVDAWFFPEGSAHQYEQARYGVFKVNRQADALLYELR